MIPKFRIFDKNFRLMLDVHVINFYEGTIDCYVDDLGVNRQEIYSYEMDEDNYVLMQSTGLHDVNGKEIFEGDVVKVSQDDDYFISFVKNMIEFDYPGFDVPFPDDWNYECNVLSHLMNTDQTIEVIGNIHEHPELLERDGE